MKIVFAKRFRAGLFCVALSAFSAVTAQADPFAYMAAGDGSFGTINLQTGAYTGLGDSGTTLYGLGVANGLLFGTAFDDAGALFSVDPATGHLTTIGTADGINYWAFGSTLAGLYGIDAETKNLYSVNATTGAATLVGNTGLTDFADWSNLSTNSSTLYFGNGADLYTIDTTTGAATFVGNSGGPHVGALVTVNGTLYGGQNPSGCEGDCGPPPCEQEDCDVPPCEIDCPVNTSSFDSQSDFNVITLNTTTGVATFQAAVTGAPDFFFGLAPTDLAAPTPEPSTALLAGISGGLIFLLRRKIRRA